MVSKSGTGANSCIVDTSILQSKNKSALRHETAQQWQRTSNKHTNIKVREGKVYLQIKKKQERVTKEGGKREGGKGRHEEGGKQTTRKQKRQV